MFIKGLTDAVIPEACQKLAGEWSEAEPPEKRTQTGHSPAGATEDCLTNENPASHSDA